MKGNKNSMHNIKRELHKYKIVQNVRERISLYSCGIFGRRTNLMISASYDLLKLQSTIPSALYAVALFPFPSLRGHNTAVRTEYLHLKFTLKEIKKS